MNALHLDNSGPTVSCQLKQRIPMTLSRSTEPKRSEEQLHNCMRMPKSFGGKSLSSSTSSTTLVSTSDDSFEDVADASPCCSSVSSLDSASSSDRLQQTKFNAVTATKAGNMKKKIQFYPGEVRGELPRSTSFFDGIDLDHIWWSRDDIQAFKNKEKREQGYLRFHRQDSDEDYDRPKQRQLRQEREVFLVNDVNEEQRHPPLPPVDISPQHNIHATQAPIQLQEIPKQAATTLQAVQLQAMQRQTSPRASLSKQGSEKLAVMQQLAPQPQTTLQQAVMMQQATLQRTMQPQQQQQQKVVPSPIPSSPQATAEDQRAKALQQALKNMAVLQNMMIDLATGNTIVGLNESKADIKPGFEIVAQGSTKDNRPQLGNIGRGNSRQSLSTHQQLASPEMDFNQMQHSSSELSWNEMQTSASELNWNEMHHSAPELNWNERQTSDMLDNQSVYSRRSVHLAADGNQAAYNRSAVRASNGMHPDGGLNRRTDDFGNYEMQLSASELNRNEVQRSSISDDQSVYSRRPVHGALDPRQSASANSRHSLNESERPLSSEARMMGMNEMQLSSSELSWNERQGSNNSDDQSAYSRRPEHRAVKDQSEYSRRPLRENDRPYPIESMSEMQRPSTSDEQSVYSRRPGQGTVDGSQSVYSRRSVRETGRPYPTESLNRVHRVAEGEIMCNSTGMPVQTFQQHSIHDQGQNTGNRRISMPYTSSTNNMQSVEESESFHRRPSQQVPMGAGQYSLPVPHEAQRTEAMFAQNRLPPRSPAVSMDRRLTLEGQMGPSRRPSAQRYFPGSPAAQLSQRSLVPSITSAQNLRNSPVESVPRTAPVGTNNLYSPMMMSPNNQMMSSTNTIGGMPCAPFLTNEAENNRYPPTVNPLDSRYWRQPPTHMISCRKGSPLSANRVRPSHLRRIRWTQGDVTHIMAPPVDHHTNISVYKDDIWWPKAALSARRTMDAEVLEKDPLARAFNRDSKQVYKYLRNKVWDMQKGNAQFTLQQLQSLLTPSILNGLAAGYHGIELGGMNHRMDGATAMVETIVKCYKNNGVDPEAFQTRTAKRRSRLNSDLTLAAKAAEMSEVDRLWAQVIALGDYQVQ